MMAFWVFLMVIFVEILRMIDYEKLKIAHDLVNKHANECNETSTLTFVYYGLAAFEYYEWNSYSHGKHTYREINDLITKLRELTEPMPKYGVGDTVYYLFTPAMKILELTVESTISCDTNECISYRYETNNGIVDEGWLYSSKEALIEAQIAYWNKQNCADNKHMDFHGDGECAWCLKEIDDNCREIYKCSHGVTERNCYVCFEGK